MDKSMQKYHTNEKVGIQGWGSYVEGFVEDIDWIWHNRLREYTWGYKIKFKKGQSNPFSMIYIPEGYLRKL